MARVDRRAPLVGLPAGPGAGRRRGSLVAPPFGVGAPDAGEGRLRRRTGARRSGPASPTRRVPLEAGPLIGAAVMQVAAGVALGFLACSSSPSFQAAGALIDLFSGLHRSPSCSTRSTASRPASSAGFYQCSPRRCCSPPTATCCWSGGSSPRSRPRRCRASAASAFAEMLTADMGRFFVAALEIAAPLVAALFLADVALGLLSRAAPEMNVFLLGLPLKILVTSAWPAWPCRSCPRRSAAHRHRGAPRPRASGGDVAGAVTTRPRRRQPKRKREARKKARSPSRPSW